ncbi:peptidoglycan-binding protein LysM [Formosa sp. S-31]|uniref:peptidoglycan-binding protein LysM n=1 Tax=Formosa sp. S-31 TaxID=2790949 RepID=UPI003EBC7715
MIKNIGSYLFGILAICSLAFFSFSSEDQVNVKAYSTQGLALNYTVNAQDVDNENLEEEAIEAEVAKVFSPYLGKSFIGFKEAVGFKESRGDYFTVNTLGYLGKYQFSKETLKMIGIHNPVHFLNNPELQERAFLANAERNKWILRRDIKRFVGKKINGILITESGILAAAHLSGPGSVKKYLRSNGQNGFEDAYGTTIEYYLKKFSGYDTSFVKPNKQAKAKIAEKV